MPGQPDNRVVILGGGPAGLGAAYLLARRGIQAIVLERNATVGGNAGSFELAGMPVDYGSHRFHPAAQPKVMQWVRELLGEDLLLRPRHGRIRLLNRWLHFPLQARDLLLNTPPSFTLGIAADLARRVLPQSKPSPESFESVLRAGLGATVCEQFYFPYARKIWGLDPAQISATQANKRVGSRTIGALLRQLRLAKAGDGSHPGKTHFYYPRYGFGQISDALQSAAVAEGAILRLGAPVTGLRLGEDRHRVDFEIGGESHSIEARHVWSTIPVIALARMTRPMAPCAVRAAAQSLRFRAMLLIYLVLETDRFTPFDAHYFPGADIRMTRLSEPKNYSGRDEPAGRTVLCAELPCQAGDEVWNMDNRSLGNWVKSDLATAGLPLSLKIAQVVVKRLPQAYPLYPVGYESCFDTLDTWVSNLPRVLTFGRQGLFAHDNTHHALFMAHEAVRCLRQDGTFDTGTWAEARHEFAGHVVED